MVHARPVVIELPAPVCDSPPVVVPPPLPTAPPPEPVADVAMVITVGDDSYVELEMPLDLPTHAAPALVQSFDAFTAIAEVEAKDLPDDLRAWKKRKVSVDGSCEARVTGFAVIGRLRGLARDAEENLDEWTADKVLEYGRPTLFARLDGCRGMVARDAASPAIAVLADSDEPGDWAERALDRFAISDPVIAAERAWLEAGNQGTWYMSSEARLDTHVMRHPRTGVTWVLVHAYLVNDCGLLGGNAIGLYRVENGKLVTDLERDEGVPRIEQVVDLEGDGKLELVGSSPDSISIERADGTDVRSLHIATFGCGC
ncbi:MAG: hypothetical protein HOV81_36980 [Kofleriaceae bacterium]|nr:hypothetical protein [Kofleriaceae bacterium]